MCLTAPTVIATRTAYSRQTPSTLLLYLFTLQVVLNAARALDPEGLRRQADVTPVQSCRRTAIALSAHARAAASEAARPPE